MRKRSLGLASIDQAIHPTDSFPLKMQGQWVLQFTNWYNYEHKHSGLKFITPVQRHNGEDDLIMENRKRVYEQARAKNPERWSDSTRNWTLPEAVWLNPERTKKDLKNSVLIYMVIHGICDN